MVRLANLHQLWFPLGDDEGVPRCIDFGDNPNAVVSTCILHCDEVSFGPRFVQSIGWDKTLDFGTSRGTKSKGGVEILPTLISFSVEESRVPEVVRRM